MNVFELQSQMVDAWANATRVAVTAVLDVWSQSMGLPKPEPDLGALVPLPFASAMSAAAPAWPMWPVPGLFQPSASPMSFGGWPFGSSFSPPFASPFSPFMSPFSPPSAMGWPFGVTAWPMMVLFMPAPTQMAFAQFANPRWLSNLSGGQFGRAPAMLETNAFLEQMATSYRTASGYAVAAVTGPGGTRLPPKEDGVPFWMLPTDRPRRDLN